MTSSLGVTEQGLEFVMFAVVVILFVVQTPIDISSHRLLRAPTVLAIITISGVYLTAFLFEFKKSDLGVALVASAVVCGFVWMMHRVSPRSLGWGDVLLVIPLVLAVSFIEISLVAHWLLLASTSAAVHGLWRWCIQRVRVIPFGPHLIGAACLVIAIHL